MTTTTLHIVHRLRDGRLPGALRRAFAPDDGLLLTGDGVYAVLADRRALPGNCHALEGDVRARGLLPQWPAEIPLLDHGGFVELCIRYGKSLSWA